MQKEIYEWKRYWEPLGNLGWRGWNGDWFHSPLEGVSVSTDEISSKSRLLILLGAAGSGKSNEVNLLRAKFEKNIPLAETLFFRATELGPQPSTTIINTKAWRKFETADDENQELVLFVDGIDEALASTPTILEQLIRFAIESHEPKLQIVFSMRTGIWNGSKYDSLFETWNTTAEEAVFELCSLSLENVKTTLQVENVEKSDDFFQWIKDNSLGPTARVAIHLKPILRHWLNNKSSAVSAKTLRDDQIKLLLRETDDRLSGPILDQNLSPTQLEKLAELLAAHAVLSGCHQFSISQQSEGTVHTLLLSQFLEAPLSGKWKCEEHEFHFTIADLRTLLNRALFRRISGPYDAPAFSFDHHSLLERLAGRAFERQPFKHLLRLLTSPANGLIAPQMASLASVLAPTNQYLSKWLLQNQPEILLMSDGFLFSDELKAEVVENVLIGIEQSDAHRRLDFSHVDAAFHSSRVSEVLSIFISGKEYKETTRAAAICIARRCPHPDLFSPLLTVLSDPDDEPYLRQIAIDSWLAIAKNNFEKNRDIVWQIAKGTLGTNRSHDRADALRLLLNKGTPVREILPQLPQSDEFVIGSLELLINQELGKALTADDLSASFDYLEKNGPKSYDRIADDRIADRVYRLTLKNLDNEDLLKRFASHWWRVKKDFYAKIGAKYCEQLQAFPSDRRKSLVDALILSPQRPAEYWYWDLGLVEQDLQWIVSSLPTINGSELRKDYLELVFHLWFSATKEEVPAWLALAYEEGSKSFRDVFPTPKKGRSFSETIRRFHRAGELRIARRQAKNEKRFAKFKNPSRSEFTAEVEALLLTTPLMGWNHFAQAVWTRLPDNGETDEGKEAGITASPGWLALSEDGRNNARKAATDFLLVKEAPYEPGKWSDWQESAYQAIDLLGESIFSSPQLREAVKDKWVDALLHRINSAEQRHQDLVVLAKKLAPMRIRGKMLKLVERSLGIKTWPLELRAFEKGWAQEDSEQLDHLLYSQVLLGNQKSRRTNLRLNLKPLGKSLRPSVSRRTGLSKRDYEYLQGITFVFHFLARLGSAQALKFSHRLINATFSLKNRTGPRNNLAHIERRRGPFTKPLSPVVHPLLLLHIVFQFPELWEEGWIALRKFSSAELRRAFLNLLPHLEKSSDYFSNGWLEALTADQAKEAYRFYCKIFPSAPAESSSKRERYLKAQDHRVRFEGSIREHLVKLGATTQILPLIDTTECESRKNTLRWHLAAARTNASQAAWKPLLFGEISSWMKSEDALLVRTCDELLEAVLSSLKRYQEWLEIDGRTKRECWQEQKDKTFRPVGEEDLSAKITDFMKSDLKSTIITREAEVRVKRKKGRSDIEVAVTVNSTALSIVIEHKRAHNSEIKTAMKEQLMERYLQPSDRTHGIYLVSWFQGFPNSKDSKNALSCSSIEEANQFIENQAKELSASTYSLKSLILNCVP